MWFSCTYHCSVFNFIKSSRNQTENSLDVQPVYLFCCCFLNTHKQLIKFHLIDWSSFRPNTWYHLKHYCLFVWLIGYCVTPTLYRSYGNVPALLIGEDLRCPSEHYFRHLSKTTDVRKLACNVKESKVSVGIRSHGGEGQTLLKWDKKFIIGR
jgi:hypothetical protein